MKNTETVYRTLFEAVRSNDIREIIRAGFEAIGRPLIFTDSSYVKLTESYPPEPQGDEKWDVYLTGQELDFQSIRNIFEYDTGYRIRGRYPIRLMDSGFFADSRRLTAQVRQGETPIGYVSALIGDSPCGEEEYETLSVIADAVAIWLNAQQGRRYEQLSLRRFFARSLIRGELRDDGELKKWQTLLELPLAPRYVLLALAPSRPDWEHFGYYLQDQLEGAGLPLLLDPAEQYLHVLLYGTRDQAHSRTLVEEIARVTERFQFVCGVSRSFTQLKELPRYRRQAEIALESGRRWQPEETIHPYRELALRAMLDAAAKQLGEENCRHPALALLEDYDRESDGAYLETLRVYALCRYSSQETCARLHIHRNTLGYRLGRIEELTGIRLEDRDTRLHLALSFLMEEKR